MNNIRRQSLRVGLLAAILSLVVPGALVRGTAHATQHEGTEPGQVVSDNELKSFAQAYKKITGIRLDYESRLSKVQDQKKAQELQQQAQTEMIRVVQDEGLTADKYNQIFAAVQQDQELRKKFNDVFQNLEKGE